jgi:hypothetical protein
MTYALVINGTIEAVGRLPRGGDADGQWIEPLTADNAHLCGWHQVVDTDRPDDTGVETWVRTIDVVDGTPTVVWVSRAWTDDELAARTAETNRQAIDGRVATHVAALRAIKNSTGTLTGAQLSNAVRALAAADLDVIRFLHNRLDALD